MSLHKEISFATDVVESLSTQGWLRAKDDAAN